MSEGGNQSGLPVAAPDNLGVSSASPHNDNRTDLSSPNWNLSSVIPPSRDLSWTSLPTVNWSALSPTNWNITVCPTDWDCSIQHGADEVWSTISHNKWTAISVLLTFLLSLCIRGNCSIISAMLDGAKVLFLIVAFEGNFLVGLGGLVVCFILGALLGSATGDSTGERYLYEYDGSLHRTWDISSIPRGARRMWQGGRSIHRAH